MIVAIDGPAGSGKSTVAKSLADRLGFHYLDTGAMYRAVAFFTLASGLSVTDESAVERIATENHVTFGHEPDNALPSRVYIAGSDVTTAIRSSRVDEAVSQVASMPRVRAAMLEQQREIALNDDIVIEGRDIGTVVFPDAEVKIYLTAAPEERARRRAAQQATTGVLVDPAGVRDSMLRRDEADSSRAVAPLSVAADAVLLDTTGLSIDDVVSDIAGIVQSRSM